MTLQAIAPKLRQEPRRILLPQKAPAKSRENVILKSGKFEIDHDLITVRPFSQDLA